MTDLTVRTVFRLHNQLLAFIMINTFLLIILIVTVALVTSPPPCQPIPEQTSGEINDPDCVTDLCLQQTYGGCAGEPDCYL